MKLHTVAQAAAVVGAVGAVALTLYAGRGNNLPFLMILMAGWVFAPFFGFALARRFSGRWSPSTRAALDVVIVLVAVASIAVYGFDVFGPLHVKRATPYVAVPIAAWLLMFTVVPVAAVLARRRDRSIGTTS